MALPSSVSTSAQDNDQVVTLQLAAREQSDAVLGQALYECWRRGYYRMLGFRSVTEYLNQHFRSNPAADAVARPLARRFQRLIREYKLAAEIPLFLEYFDRIQPSNRRLVAPILTRDNAAEWIPKSIALTARDLELAIQAATAKKTVHPDERAVKTLRLFAGQLELLEKAFAAARRMAEADGKDPLGIPEGDLLEEVVSEYLATYGAGDGGRQSLTCRAECPACRKMTLMDRLQEDDVDGTLVYRCECGALSVMRAISA